MSWMCAPALWECFHHSGASTELACSHTPQNARKFSMFPTIWQLTLHLPMTAKISVRIRALLKVFSSSWLQQFCLCMGTVSFHRTSGITRIFVRISVVDKVCSYSFFSFHIYTSILPFLYVLQHGIYHLNLACWRPGVFE